MKLFLLTLLLSLSLYSLAQNKHQTQLNIIQKAEQILSDSTKWNQNDDRVCTDDQANGQWSLYCALHQAYVEVKGKYKHRGLVIRRVRWAIRKASAERFKHPIRDYNNLESVIFKDVQHLLGAVKKRLL